MKLVSKALIVAGLMTLGACGGGTNAADNSADLNAVDENLTLPPEDLANLSEAPADANAVDANAAGADAETAAPVDANATANAQ